MELIPIGARILVEDIEAVDDLTERAKRAGLEVVVLEHNKPRPTTARVIALGKDPLVAENIHLDDTVFFHRHSGSFIQIEGRQLRSLELQEVISVLCPHRRAGSQVYGIPDTVAQEE
jgi:co-chaperonin GroES (HSP10)